MFTTIWDNYSNSWFLNLVSKSKHNRNLNPIPRTLALANDRTIKHWHNLSLGWSNTAHIPGIGHMLLDSLGDLRQCILMHLRDRVGGPLARFRISLSTFHPLCRRVCSLLFSPMCTRVWYFASRIDTATAHPCLNLKVRVSIITAIDHHVSRPLCPRRNWEIMLQFFG